MKYLLTLISLLFVLAATSYAEKYKATKRCISVLCKDVIDIHFLSIDPSLMGLGVSYEHITDSNKGIHILLDYSDPNSIGIFTSIRFYNSGKFTKRYLSFGTGYSSGFKAKRADFDQDGDGVIGFREQTIDSLWLKLSTGWIGSLSSTGWLRNFTYSLELGVATPISTGIWRKPIPATEFHVCDNFCFEYSNVEKNKIYPTFSFLNFGYTF